MNCLKCGNDVDQLTKREKKFCSDTCRTRYNMKIRYERLKNDPDFKIKNRARSKAWYEQNKEKHKIKSRIYMREYYRKHYSKFAKNEKKDI